MIQEQRILRYSISSWRQLIYAKSNNSSKLSISVSDFLQDRRLSGTRIQLIHKDFGVLFACVVDVQGDIITEIQEDIITELTPDQILSELRKYGYYIEYRAETKLKSKQLEYLFSIKNLGFDKISILYVHSYNHGIKDIRWYVVAFKVKDNSDWINNWYSPSHTEFMEAISNGSAINISKISFTEKFRWDWLMGAVMSVDDILEANS